MCQAVATEMNSVDLKRLIESRRAALVGLGLALATLGVYGRVAGFEFTNYDDYFMLVHNPIVSGGFTWQGLLWALSTAWFEYWHPLTWLSHMLDYELFGPSPGWHHLISLAFHVANTLLLFAVLRRMTGALWRSAMVAALFALHPLHVESVAWLAERKDVLSAFFFLLTLWAYARYVECETVAADGSRRTLPQSQESAPTAVGGYCNAPRLWYWAAVVLFALGLMSKPMLVTLPFVLLLLDYWPLGRLPFPPLHHSTTPLLRFIREKLPFFALTIASCAITLLGAKAGGNILSPEKVPWGLRLANVPVSYARYLGKMFWPADLAVLYPLPSHWAGWQVGGAVLVLVLVSLFVALRARSAPYGLVGWLIFLGMLFPTIGLVPVGIQSIADRYTYLPSIGLFIAVVWAAAEWRRAASSFDENVAADGSRRTFPQSVKSAPTTVGGYAGKAWLTGAGAVVLLLCGYLTWVQTSCWRNSFTLWTHCLAVTRDNVNAHYNLGYALQHSGQIQQAIDHYEAALRIEPDHHDVNLNLGVAMAALGQTEKATNYFAKELRLKPDYAKAHEDMALALDDLGDFAAAEKHARQAVRLEPDNVRAYFGLARALSGQGKSDEALGFYAEVLRRNPREPMIHFYLGLEWFKRGRFGQAVSSLEEAVRLDPAWAEARALLERATKDRATSEAMADYREALRLNPDLPEALNNLAWILATHPEPQFRNGAEAVELASRACERTAWKQTVFVGTLAAAHAEAGEFDKAVATAQRACELAASLGQTNLLERNRELLRLYQDRQPCRAAN